MNHTQSSFAVLLALLLLAACRPTPPAPSELAALPVGLALNPQTAPQLTPYLRGPTAGRPADIVKVTLANLDLLPQAGPALCALHLPPLPAYTPDALLALLTPADLARCAFLTLSIEAHALPAADVADPAPFLASVRALADHFGKGLIVAVPTYRFVDRRGNPGGRRDLAPNSGLDAARFADILIVEAQKSVDDPTSFAALLRQVRPAALAINPHIQVWAMIGCAAGRCQDSVAAFEQALRPLAAELDGIWIFYPPDDPALALAFLQKVRG